MPAEYPGITFDAEGLCSHCAGSNQGIEHTETGLLGKKKLAELFRSATKKGQYDCVVPLSGGKDSIYVLYYSVRELGLKPIAVTYDSGFLTEVARENVRNACDALHVPCIIERANMRIQKRLLKDSLKMSQVVGSFVRTCINCSTLIKAIPIRVAKQQHIPFILWGDSIRESVRLVRLRSKVGTVTYDDVRSRRFLTALAEKMARLKEVRMTPGKFVRLIPLLVHYRLLSTCQLLSRGVPLKYVVFPNREPTPPRRGPQVIHFFDYVHWDPVRDLALLRKELKWHHPPDRTSRFDCSLYCFTNYGCLRANGITADGVIACNLIREGLVTRAEALQAEESRRHMLMEDCACVANQLGLKDCPGRGSGNNRPYSEQ
ncbi:MAG TPA: hypothetical protein P5068_04410 [Sedimentisphaerales bacterium]|nr:hypothetical protein [Sedimentisphaerales bacterium]HRV46983.1 hypothetical protein [Sedimentisphaerales bacterium]